MMIEQYLLTTEISAEENKEYHSTGVVKNWSTNMMFFPQPGPGVHRC